MGWFNMVQVDPCSACKREDDCGGCVDVDMANWINPEIAAFVAEEGIHVADSFTETPDDAPNIEDLRVIVPAKIDQILLGWKDPDKLSFFKDKDL